MVKNMMYTFTHYKYILRHMDPLLGNDREISKYKTAVAWKLP
jgi:hypothetical protein